jgi:hypothetical protein
MNFYLAFFIGGVLGFFIGFLLCALLSSGKKEDECHDCALANILERGGNNEVS